MSKYFPKLYGAFSRDINVSVDTSNFALKRNLANLKTEVDQLDINKSKSLPNNLSKLKTKVDKLDTDKLVTVPIDSSKLSNVVKNDVAKKMN